MLGALPVSFVTTALANLVLAVLSVITYVSAHAAEVVYFYGLRALRAERAPVGGARDSFGEEPIADYEGGQGSPAP
jgi:hypothetical protein